MTTEHSELPRDGVSQETADIEPLDLLDLIRQARTDRVIAFFYDEDDGTWQIRWTRDEVVTNINFQITSAYTFDRSTNAMRTLVTDPHEEVPK